MPLMRNLARVLRDEKGAIDGQAIGLSFGATSLGLGAAVDWASGNALAAIAAALISFPLQLVGMASKPTAKAVAITGAVVTGGALTLIVAGIARVFLPFGIGFLSWIPGALAGVGGFFWVRHRFNQAIEKLNADPGWY